MALLRRLLRRLPAVAFLVALGVSIGGNWAVAHPSPSGRLAFIWAPVAAAFVVGCIEQAALPTGWRRAVVLAGSVPVGGVALWASYLHLAKFFESAGIDHALAHALPISVDGLLAVAGAYLVPEKIASAPKRSQVVRPSAPARVTAVPEPAEVPDTPPRPALSAERPAGGEARRGRAVNVDERDRVRALAAANPEWSQRRLAAEAGVPQTTVRRYLKPDEEAEPAAAGDALADEIGQYLAHEEEALS